MIHNTVRFEMFNFNTMGFQTNILKQKYLLLYSVITFYFII